MAERFELPVWLKHGPEVSKLSSAFSSYWGKMEGWLKTPINQTNAENCHVAVLQLLAYQRDVDRFANEPEKLFRKRVAFAVQNAQSAGCSHGFKEIFERFGLPLLGQIERDSDKEWDVITLWLGDSTLTKDPELGQYIVRQYGRTCRRYEFLLVDITSPVTAGAATASVDRQATSALSIPDWIFQDISETHEVGYLTASIERQSTHAVAIDDYEFIDITEHGISMFSASVERYEDKVRGI